MRAQDLTGSARQLAALLCSGSDTVVSAVLDDGLLDAALAHGVAPILYRTFKDNGRLDGLAAPVRHRLALAAREAALYDEVQRRDLHQVLGALAAEGIRPLLFKGAALAQSHYAATWLRPRGDVDLLLTEDSAMAAGAVLEARGFDRLPRPIGPHVSQARYVARVGGVELAYDVHWRLAEPQAFAGSLAFEELAAAAVNAETGRRLGDVHALLVACMHRVAHHHDTDHLILICDIDRLARGLNDASWREAAALAVDRGLAAVSLRGLTLARQGFATPVPDTVCEALAARAADEPGNRFLDRPMRPIDVLASDLRTLPSWRARASLVRRHLFPSAEYMRATHGSTAGLATMYARRIARGARRWTRPLGSSNSEVRSTKDTER